MTNTHNEYIIRLSVTQIAYLIQKGGILLSTALKYPNIEAERARLGLSQDDLSEKLGTTRKTYYNWTSSGNIPVQTLSDLADMFDCSVDYLLGRTRNPMPYPKT